MSLNSVNTNSSALVALQSLNRTNTQLDLTQKRVSTGFRVSDAKDDGGAFAVAQKVRADMAGLVSANEQLGATKGLMDTTLAGLGRVSDTLQQVRAVVVKLADNQVTGELRKAYEDQYTQLRNQVARFVNDSVYNGVTLLGTSTVDGSPQAQAGTTFKVVRNEVGGTFDITGQALTGATTNFDLAGVGAADDYTVWQKRLTGTSGNERQVFTVGAAGAAGSISVNLGDITVNVTGITATDTGEQVATKIKAAIEANPVANSLVSVSIADSDTTTATNFDNLVIDFKGPRANTNVADVAFTNTGVTSTYTKDTDLSSDGGTGAASVGDLAWVERNVNKALNEYGNANKQVDNQIAFNKDKLDALESGLGALIDADLAKEAARLQSLQIRQQLGATALSTANSAPQVLLSLFR